MSDNTTNIDEYTAEMMYRTMRYKRLHTEAYGYPPTQFQVDSSLEMYRIVLVDVMPDLEEMLSESHGLYEVCRDVNIPEWMSAAAPNPETYNRWRMTGIM